MAANEDSTLLSKLTILRDLNLRSAPRTILPADSKRIDPRAFSISIGLLYTGIERDYWENGRKSIRDLRMRWHVHLEKVFASIPADTLTTQQVTSYVTQRLAESPRPANATINRELATLKRMYKLGVKHSMLKLSDVPYFPMLRERNTRKGFLNDARYVDLARTTSEGGLYLRALFEIAVNYGWRKSELISMRCSQVDVTERSITLNPGETKNDQARMVRMTAVVHELLRGLVAGKQPSDKVFTRGRGNRPISGFRKAWKTATTKAGCPGLLFHDLRRSAVRNLLRDGVTEKVAMELAGFKTRSVFDRYHIVCEEDLDRAVLLMESGAVSRGSSSPVPSAQQQAELPFEDVAPRKGPAPLSTPEDRSRIAAKAAQTRWSREKRPA
jgi:integrase